MTDTTDSPGDRPCRPQRTVISADSRPRLPRHMKLRHDATRDRWMILGPERVFTPDAIAVAVLELCDGHRTVAEVADTLSLRYSAPKEQILTDITAMLQDLADKGVVRA